MRRPGIEPGPSAWKADILTTRPTTLLRKFLETSWIAAAILHVDKMDNDSSGVRTHALSDQRLKLAP